jgi:DNA modification methylase
MIVEQMLKNAQTPLLHIADVMCWAVDNLELLKSQPDESVDLIYCDILYGTGRNFGDYQDLKPIRSEIEAHYLPRLKEMHRVLKSTGSIYLQMDYRINHWIRCLMDEVFGYDKFRNEIVWCYTMPNNYKKAFNRKHDTIYFYSKSDNWTFNWKDVTVEYSESSKNRAKYAHSKTSQMGKNGSMLLEEGKLPEDYWLMPVVAGNERIGYQTQKPKVLIERIIKASSNEGDTVADYYLGSGTTAVVCKELNRYFIGCDINPKAIEITKARLNAGT